MPADFFCSHRLVLSGVILGRVLLLIWENSDRIEHMIRLWLYNILRELLKSRAAFAEKKHAQFCMWRAREVFSLLGFERTFCYLMKWFRLIFCVCAVMLIFLWNMSFKSDRCYIFNRLLLSSPSSFFSSFFCMYCYLIIAPLFQLSKSDIALLMILSFTLGLLCHLFHPIQS